jgi:uncharacterized membrane protein YeaQ/YmgE (transglycosylase-associated protein family)
MNVIVRILVGALTGWLTGKALEVTGRVNVVREGHVLDAIYGVVGSPSSFGIGQLIPIAERV